MKLLVDENLPRRLPSEVADLFPESDHVSSLGLSRTADESIWQFARQHDFTIITKDKDFASLSLAWGAPPKVILLQTGNCSSSALIDLVRKNAIRISEFHNEPGRSVLILR